MRSHPSAADRYFAARPMAFNTAQATLATGAAALVSTLLLLGEPEVGDVALALVALAVYSLCSPRGGRVWVEGSARGGATFHVELPLEAP